MYIYDKSLRSVVTPEAKDAYVRHVREKEGIVLNEAKIRNNPAQRTMAKLFLNSAYGSQSKLLLC